MEVMGESVCQKSSSLSTSAPLGATDTPAIIPNDGSDSLPSPGRSIASIFLLRAISTSFPFPLFHNDFSSLNLL
jgi:hypothetical protein